MKYIIEQYKFENDNGFHYYHLVDSREFESNTVGLEHKYSKNGSYFIITQFNDDVQSQSGRIRSKVKKNVG